MKSQWMKIRIVILPVSNHKIFNYEKIIIGKN